MPSFDAGRSIWSQIGGNESNRQSWTPLSGDGFDLYGAQWVVTASAPKNAIIAVTTNVSTDQVSYQCQYLNSQCPITYPATAKPTNWDYGAMNGDATAATIAYQSVMYNMHYNALLGNQTRYLYNYRETDEQATQRLKEEMKREAKREAAARRAEKLLFTILTPSQVKQYTDDAHFDLPINGRVYRIRAGRSGNVQLIEAGKPKFQYCAHPTDAHDTPIPDVMLSQLLMLQSNEAEFLRIANRTVLQ